jgi:RimJ/RimL family protein N-acetyltransferase
VDLTSLGYRTDLALLRLGATEIEDRGDHLVVRSPDNPTFWWGNFLLLARLPEPTEVDGWLERFAAAFPAARHVAIGVDGVDGVVEDLAPFAERGMRCQASTVMTAELVHEPPRPNPHATYRRLTSGADWAQSIELQMACRDDGQEEAGHREFATRRAGTYRRLVGAGHGAWFGAFLDGELVSQMGLFRAGEGLARFQAVETHPSVRGQGLAGTLVHRVGGYGLDELGATRLVMTADPDYLAVRVYRSVGFLDCEVQLEAQLSVQRALG